MGSRASNPYDAIAEVYDDTRHLPPSIAERVASRVIGRTGAGRAARVVEIGCGTGRIGRALAGAGGVSYLGVDLSRPMLLRFRGADGGAALVQGDLLHLPIGTGAVDAVVSCHVLQNVPALAPAIDEILRVLRAGGVYVHCTDELPPHQRECDLLWQSILAEIDRGYEVRPRYDMRRDDLIPLCAARGLGAEVATLGSWIVTHRVEQLVAAYERKAYPSCWRVSDASHALAVAELRRALLARHALDDAVSSRATLDALFVEKRQ